MNTVSVGCFFLLVLRKRKGAACAQVHSSSQCVCVCVCLMSLISGTHKLCTERQQPKLIMTAKPAPERLPLQYPDSFTFWNNRIEGWKDRRQNQGLPTPPGCKWLPKGLPMGLWALMCLLSTCGISGTWTCHNQVERRSLAWRLQLL